MRAMRPPMRLFMTTDAVGGVWRYSVDVGRTLAARGVEPTLVGIGPRPTAAQEREVQRAGMDLLWLDCPLEWAAGDRDRVRDTGHTLNDLLRRHRPGMLHLNGPALAPFLGPDLPRVVAVHSCLATWWRAVKGTPLPVEWRWHQEMTWAGLRSATVAVVPSEAFAADLRAVYGRLPALRVVRNGAAAVAPAPKGGFVLSAGRWWDEAKNFGVLDAAAAQIRWPVCAAGALEGAGAHAPTAEAIEWIGDLPHATLSLWISRAPVFVSLSLYEPFGLAVLEAAGAGAALVLADIPTFREMWDGCALFADPRDPMAVSWAVNRLIDDNGLRDRLGGAARVRASGCSLAAQADALLDAYSSVGALSVAV